MFFAVWDVIWGQVLSIDLPSNFSKYSFFAHKLCYIKIKVSQAQSNWFVLKEVPACNRGLRRCAHRLWPWIGLREFNNSYAQ